MQGRGDTCKGYPRLVNYLEWNIQDYTVYLSLL